MKDSKKNGGKALEAAENTDKGPVETQMKASSKVLSLQDKQHARHKKIQRQMSYGALIILVIVVISFIAWPILIKGVDSGENISLGSYRDQPIDYLSEYGLFNSNFNSLLNQFGIDSISSDYQRRIVFERAFFSTIGQYGRYFYLLDRGNAVSQKEANALIYEQLTRDGKLDRAAWNQLQGDPNRLKNAQNIMTYAAAQDVWNDVFESMDLINDKELELLIPTLGDVRKVSYLYYRVSDYPEFEVENFYNANKKLFQKHFLRRIVVDSQANRKKVQSGLEGGDNFGELAQLYSNDIHNQENGDYGNKFYYELRDFFSRSNDIEDEKAAQWCDSIFTLKKDEYAGPYELNNQWYFFQVKTEEEIQTEEAADLQGGEADNETLQNPDADFAAVAATVRNYIETNEVANITNYFRKNLESLKSQAKSLDSLADVDQEGREVEANYSLTPEFFGFSYSGKDGGTALYDSMDAAFTEDGLALAISKSKLFFENIFSLEPGQLSDVILFGVEDALGRSDQQYLAFFRLEEARESNVRDFARSETEGLESKKSLFNYYLNHLLTGGIELTFLNNRNLKQRFESAYGSLGSMSSQN